MSVFSKESFQVIAESLSVPELKDDVATALAADVEFHVREIIQDAVKFMKHSKRSVLVSADINSALRLRHSEQTYGHTSATNQQRFAAVSGVGGLFYLEDTELSIEDVLSAPLPPCPKEPALASHWLAIEGVTPAIPQNPSLEEIARTLHAAEGSHPGKRKRIGTSDDVQIKALVEQALSEELQLYFETVTNGLQTNRNVKQIIESLSCDAGLQPLVPYLIQFLFDEVTLHLTHLPYLGVLMRLARALLGNTNVNVEPYLHQMMPPLLTCVVGKRLCDDPQEDHWQLREDAASIVTQICETYSPNYPLLQSRVTKTFITALLDPTKPLTSHYGSLVGLASLGFRVIQLLIVPNVKVYLKDILSPKMEAAADIVEKQCGEKVFHKLAEICGRFLSHLMKENAAKSLPLPLRAANAKKGNTVGSSEDKMEVDQSSSSSSSSSPQEASQPGSLEEAVENVLAEDWLRYYGLFSELFGELLSPYLPPMEEFPENPSILL